MDHLDLQKVVVPKRYEHLFQIHVSNQRYLGLQIYLFHLRILSLERVPAYDLYS